MTVQLKWVPTLEASDHRAKGWREISLYSPTEPLHFLMASPVEEKPAKTECPNCGEDTRGNTHIERPGSIHYVCCRRTPAQPAQPGEISELDDRDMRLASPEAQTKFRADMDRRVVEIGMDRLVGVANRPISETVTVGTWQLEELLKYADYAEVALRTGFHPPDFIFEPAVRSLRQCIDAIKEQRDQWRAHAQPEIDTTKTVAYCDELDARAYKPAPVAAGEEMPLPVLNAIAGLLRAADAGTADALEAFWRSQPALRMTREFRMVEDAAAARGLWHLDNGQPQQFNEIADAIAAVREQYAHAQPRPKLEKVRSLFNVLEGHAAYLGFKRLRDEALAELDAAEGR